jgi:hypothetical protein
MGKTRHSTKEAKKQPAMSFDERRAKKRAKKHTPEIIPPTTHR